MSLGKESVTFTTCLNLFCMYMDTQVCTCKTAQVCSGRRFLLTHTPESRLIEFAIRLTLPLSGKLLQLFIVFRAIEAGHVNAINQRMSLFLICDLLMREGKITNKQIALSEKAGVILEKAPFLWDHFEKYTPRVLRYVAKLKNKRKLSDVLPSCADKCCKGRNKGRIPYYF